MVAAAAETSLVVVTTTNNVTEWLRVVQKAKLAAHEPPVPVRPRESIPLILNCATSPYQ
jgi:hypothetical protein